MTTPAMWRGNWTEAKAQLARASERYSPDHPDVVRLTRVVGELEKAVHGTPGDSSVDAPGEKAHPDNPAYIQVKGQLDALHR